MAEGFRAVLRNPSLVLAELAWRWAFGAAALALVAVSVYEVQRAVTISPTDEFLLASMQPMLMAQAWGHILQQTLPLLARVAAVLLPSLSLMWVAAATAGRGLTIRQLVEAIKEPQEIEVQRTKARGTCWGALVALHLFRAAVALAVVLGYVGSAVVASRFVRTPEPGSEAMPDIELALIVFVLVFSVVLLIAAAINWVLSLAPVFAVRDGRGTWQSLGESMRMFRERGSQFTTVATMNGFLRFAAACVATVAGIVPLAMLGEVPNWVVWGAVVIVTVAYFAVSDWLLLARLGAYVAIVERAEAGQLQGSPLPVAQPNQSS